MTKRKALALLLMLGFGLALAYAVHSYPQQRRVATKAPGPANVRQPADKKPLRTALLVPSHDSQRPDYGGYRADLFRPLFSRPPAPPAPRPKKRPVAKKRPVEPPSPPVAAQPAMPMPEKPPLAKKLASFTYLGQVNQGTRQSIFLKGKGPIFIVRQGERFGEKNEFCLARITEKEIRITTEGLTQPIRIPLQKKQPLKMSAAPERTIRTAQNQSD
jgi:hypothetical protein